MNMSYCRFQNTLNDLQDCYNHWRDDENVGDEAAEESGQLSLEEERARRELLKLCLNIVDEFEDHFELIEMGEQ